MRFVKRIDNIANIVSPIPYNEHECSLYDMRNMNREFTHTSNHDVHSIIE